MTIIHHEIRASCPPERLWDLLSDLQAVKRYNPSVREVSVNGQRLGIGAERTCELAPRGRVVERVTHWEEGRVVGLEVIDSDWPVRAMRWITTVEPMAGGSIINQRLEYALKFGPLGWLMDRLVVRRKLSGMLDAVFASLVKLAEGRR